MSSGHWALEAAICSQPLAFTASLALLSSLSLLVFVVSPSVLQIKACVRDRQARGASNLFQLCCRRDSPFSSLSLPSLSILITERDQKTVSEAVFLIDAGRGDRKRLQIPGSQREIMTVGWEGLPGNSKVKAFFFLDDCVLNSNVGYNPTLPPSSAILTEMEGHGGNNSILPVF